MAPAAWKRNIIETEKSAETKAKNQSQVNGRAHFRVDRQPDAQDNNDNDQAAKVKIFLQAIRKVMLALSSVDDVDDLYSQMRDSIIAEGGDDIMRLKEFIDRFSRLLREKGGKSPAPNRGTLVGMEDYFLLRDGGHTMTLLAPVEIPFKPGWSMKRKVFGFVRRHDSYFPLICSISGSSVPADNHNHEKLLDSSVWTEQVHRLGTFYRHRFRLNGFDEHHGHPKGTSFASHVEPKLMLWYACRLFTKLNGGEPLPLDEQVDMVPGGLKLLIGNTKPKADIFVTRNPCTDCDKFRLLMKKKTGIEFSFIVMANLGKRSETRDEKGRHVYMSPDEDEGEDIEKDIEKRMPRILSSSFRVIITQNRETQLAVQGPSTNTPRIQKKNPETTKKKVVKSSAYDMSLTNNSGLREPSRKRLRELLEEEDEYELPSSSAVRTSKHFASKKSMRNRSDL